MLITFMINVQLSFQLDKSRLDININQNNTFVCFVSLAGNNESLRKLLELSGTKIEGASTSSDAKKDENPSFVSYKGSFLDIESLISRLEKSEKTRTTLENSLSQLNGELSMLFLKFSHDNLHSI